VSNHLELTIADLESDRDRLDGIIQTLRDYAAAKRGESLEEASPEQVQTAGPMPGAASVHPVSTPASRAQGSRNPRLRVSIDGEGEYSSGEASRKLGCTPSAIRLSANHHHLCTGRAIAEVGAEATPAAERLAGKLPGGKARKNSPRCDRMLITCDQHPEWGQVDVCKAAELGGAHHSAIRLGLKLGRPTKGLMFRPAKTPLGAYLSGDMAEGDRMPKPNMPDIRQATSTIVHGDRQMVMGVTREKQDSEAKPSLPRVQLPERGTHTAAREVWVVGHGGCNLREACSKCGVSFDTLRRRLDNGGGECRNAVVYWADEYLARIAKERGR
jgi:hypothetical protein